MRLISVGQVQDLTAGLCAKANFQMPADVFLRLKQARATETSARAKKALDAIIENARIAARSRIALCQDSGLPCVFVELGSGLCVRGDLSEAIQRGVERGYKTAFLRNSIVSDPLARGRPSYRPALIHVEIVRSDKLKLTVLPKGFGSENKTQLRMFTPTAALGEIEDFVISAVKSAGADACPPYVIGLGIGATADYALLMAKKALLCKLTTPSPARRRTLRRSALNSVDVPRHNRAYDSIARLERKLLRKINQLNIGPMGMGGRTTALAVNILSYPTHIAGLPVGVNISCHALRRATGVL